MFFVVVFLLLFCVCVCRCENPERINVGFKGLLVEMICIKSCVCVCACVRAHMHMCVLTEDKNNNMQMTWGKNTATVNTSIRYNKWEFKNLVTEQIIAINVLKKKKKATLL